ncbi:hypothetical protein [Antarcticirhabdus aurantiaca]|uniref:Uncharacterized protein n=1 Tax=Antarcticirhabdus aurantiaca TaxID=2606717 RepID=A0ACD4NRV3_9HYPH|nr:hypothetical protein [Antarcticirhabdus aurantiaca]WAJ29442.1 hypothetical protein OXU80_04175 [Jeongeuplla avenae]
MSPFIEVGEFPLEADAVCEVKALKVLEVREHSKCLGSVVTCTLQSLHEIALPHDEAVGQGDVLVGLCKALQDGAPIHSDEVAGRLRLVVDADGSGVGGDGRLRRASLRRTPHCGKDPPSRERRDGGLDQPSCISVYR